MQDAQQSIKASMSANAEESLASTENVDSKDDLKRESSKRKGPFLCFFITGFFYFCEHLCVCRIININHIKCKLACKRYDVNYNKSSAIAEMVTVATVDIGRKEGGCCAAFVGSWDPV